MKVVFALYVFLLLACTITDPAEAFFQGVPHSVRSVVGGGARRAAYCKIVQAASVRNIRNMAARVVSGSSAEDIDMPSDSSTPSQHMLGRRMVLSGALAALLFPLSDVVNAEETAAKEGRGETILVIGATGAIGQYVMRSLASKGSKIRGLTRYPKEAKEVFGSEIEWVGGDLRDEGLLNDKEFFRNLMRGVDRVVFAAGAHGWEDLANNRKIYLLTVNAMLDACRQLGGIKRFVLVSSGGVSRDPSLYNDYIKDVFQWKLAGEEAVRGSGYDYTIIRPYIYSRDPVPPAGVVLSQGDMDVAGGAISLDNLAETVVDSLFSPGAVRKTFEVKDGPPLSPAEPAGPPVPGTDKFRAAVARLVPDPAPAAGPVRSGPLDGPSI